MTGLRIAPRYCTRSLGVGPYSNRVKWIVQILEDGKYIVLNL